MEANTFFGCYYHKKKGSCKLHHYPVQKIGVINTLVTSAIKVSNENHLDQEIENFSTTFKNNNYNETQINRVIQKAQRGPRRQQNEE
jgi:hypothetical protein